jgi:transcriptional regulator with XRE-family HTH domain
MDPSFNVKRLRGRLAEEQITTRQYAQACGLSRVYVGTILSGRVRPGPIAVERLRAGLAVLGLEMEAERVAV